jgi:hypothetical protein
VSTSHRIFLLSPANTAGKRASYLFNESATFELARQLRTPAGATIGETFAFLSGLYFRGKLAYAHRFASAPTESHGAWVITTSRGLVRSDTFITLADLRAMSQVSIHPDEPLYRKPLQDSSRALFKSHPRAQFILLGSVASGKYLDILADIFCDQLFFPQPFAGLGDMARGGMMLRHVRENREMEYVPLDHGAFRGTTAHRKRK